MATTPSETGPALAILIDADNANPAIVRGLIDEVAKLGRATVRRIVNMTALAVVDAQQEAGQA